MAMKEHYNQHIFNIPEVWEDYDSTGEISAKIPLIMEKIPTDVSSIIDVGCGNGEITNLFPEKYSVLGVDFSEEALKHVKTDKLKSSCDDMSEVSDRSFDMVFSSELLEHLPSEMLKNTLSEFDRISSKYIFISVPNQEQLQHYHIKCPSCSTVFHAYGHLQSFTVKNLHQMLGDSYRVIWSTTSGKQVKSYNPWLLNLRHRIAGKYFAPSKYTVCPNCENRDYPEHKGNLLSKVFNGLNHLIPSRSKNYWLMALFVKDNGIGISSDSVEYG